MGNKISVIIDIMSIQKYIYASNKLKENIGASSIIKGLFGENIGPPYGEYFKAAIKNGYEGGGNAVLIFDGLDKTKVKDTIKEFTLYVLAKYPGIDLGIGIDYDFDGKSLDNAYKELQKSKNRFIPVTNILSHGITAECSHTGLSAEVYYGSDSEGSYISFSSCVKLNKVDEIKKGVGIDDMQKILDDNGLGDKYCFTDELEKLGSKKNEDSHIAFVAIDGNSMSDRFMAGKTLKDKQALSETLRGAVGKSFIDLLKIIRDEFEEINDELDIKSEREKKILPIRPIVLGGDDVSFVCEGSMGIYFACRFLKLLEKQGVSDRLPLSASAGIAIAHSKYPIYRIQKIAEELLSNAKDKRKSEKEPGKVEKTGEAGLPDVIEYTGSYIDFQMFYGGIFGELNEIRKNHYENRYGKMYMRPYKIENIETLMKPLEKMNCLAESKIKELRAVLNKTESERGNFIEHMRMRSRTVENSDSGAKSFLIPDEIFGKSYSKDFYNKGETPYFDLIELLEILPEYVIKRGSLHG